jgi:5-methylcytosine-specific restriction protein A
VLGEGSVEGIGRAGSLEYVKKGLPGHPSHTYQREISYLVKSSEPRSVKLRSLNEKFGKDEEGNQGDCSLYSLQGTIREYDVNRRELQELLKNLESREEDIEVGEESDPLWPSPKMMPVEADEIPDDLDFEVGQRYNRWDLHDVYGDQRYSGISTPADYPGVFLLTGDSGEEYGYEDKFLPDGRFLYTGEGQEGDMEWNGGNAAIRDHKQNNEELHVFEDTDEAWVVTYIGQFEYVDHRIDTLPDEAGTPRDAFRFELEPVGGEEIETENPDQMDLDELYERAKASSPTDRTTSSSGSSSSGSRSYPRSEIVKRYALREADGVCQGCGEDAPFIGTDGEPFLEVHHLYRRSDGGADDPDNVVALCPNCHRQVHYGEDGDEFNQELIQEKQ